MTVALNQAVAGTAGLDADQTAAVQGLVSGIGAGVSNVTYDGSNRCTGFKIGTTTYTVNNWGTSTVTISGSDGTTRTISVDGSNRITGVT